MAKLTSWALFWRAFFLTLVFGSAATPADRGEADAWNAAVGANTAEGYYRYLSLYPAGEYVDEAVEALSRLGAIGTGTRGLGGAGATAGGATQGSSSSPGVYP